MDSNQTVEVTKKKKPIFLRWWFILLAIIVIAIIATIVINNMAVLKWKDVILNDMIPEPPGKIINNHDNSSEGLYIDVEGLSDKDFDEYIEACKKQGFDNDIKVDNNSYRAFNDDGYELNLDKYTEYVSIDIDAPIKMSEIKWPEGIAGKLLPIPKSDYGKFNFEYEDSFGVLIGNMTFDDYNEYIEMCSDVGFNINYQKGDDYYRAHNQDNWYLSLSYEGNNVILIKIELDEVDDTQKPAETTGVPSQSESGIRDDFKAAMDSYEKFMNEYVAFMKKYKANPSDLGLLSDYADYVSKYADFVSSFNAWENSDLNNAELSYYIDVQSRVSKMLLEIAN